LAASETVPVSGVLTDATLGAVLQALPSRLHKEPDLVLATGDIADTGHRAAYERFLKHMRRLRSPVYGLPGNHDHAGTFFKICKGMAPKWIDIAGWRIVLLDSSLPGQDAGRLSKRALDGLSMALDGTTGPVLVVVHHHPVPVHSSWLDEFMLMDSASFFECMAPHPQVQAVLCGHVHQEHEYWFQRDAKRYKTALPPIQVLASPSTAFQFAPRSKEFQLDALGPGFRWMLLHPNGRLETGVEYLNKI
ncbi:MAG TPA: metallophosphoesterase, partial [Pusillimonas sp.]|uniref:metallophosphoesterase n=1 Tax=Pusillimonas sp. TaxID=3040095 RepID=UPI002C9824C1